MLLHLRALQACFTINICEQQKAQRTHIMIDYYPSLISKIRTDTDGNRWIKNNASWYKKSLVFCCNIYYRRLGWKCGQHSLAIATTFLIEMLLRKQFVRQFQSCSSSIVDRIPICPVSKLTGRVKHCYNDILWILH